MFVCLRGGFWPSMSTSSFSTHTLVLEISFSEKKGFTFASHFAWLFNLKPNLRSLPPSKAILLNCVCVYNWIRLHTIFCLQTLLKLYFQICPLPNVEIGFWIDFMKSEISQFKKSISVHRQKTSSQFGFIFVSFWTRRTLVFPKSQLNFNCQSTVLNAFRLKFFGEGIFLFQKVCVDAFALKLNQTLSLSKTKKRNDVLCKFALSLCTCRKLPYF